MRFKIPSLLANLKNDHITESEHHISAHEESIISRGQQNSFRQFIQQIRNIVGEEQQEQMLIMVQMDQEIGNMSISLIRKNTKPKQNEHSSIITNQTSTAIAIAQYQKDLANSIHSLKSGIEEVKRNRVFYNRFLQESKKKSMINQANNLITKLVELCPSQIVGLKPRTASEDTSFTDYQQLIKVKRQQKIELLQNENDCSDCQCDWFGGGLHFAG